MNKYAVAVFNRNNYPLFRDFTISKLFNTIPKGIKKIAVDDCSDLVEITRAKDDCYLNKIQFLQNYDRGIQHCIQTASDYIKDFNCKWLIVFQSDAYPMHPRVFWKNLANELNKKKYDQFGTIGFNVAADDCGCNIIKAKTINKEENNPMYVLGRCPLVTNPSIYWYRPSDIDMSLWPRDPFAVEIPNWQVIGINLELFRKNIIPTNKYHMHFAWDDIAMQFLNINIFNVAIPKLYCIHEQSIKEKYGIIKHSVSAIKDAWHGGIEGARYMGTANHHVVWKERWGWNYEGKDMHEEITKRYIRTLLHEFRHHNLAEGPYKVFK